MDSRSQEVVLEVLVRSLLRLPLLQLLQTYLIPWRIQESGEIRNGTQVLLEVYSSSLAGSRRARTRRRYRDDIWL